MGLIARSDMAKLGGEGEWVLDGTWEYFAPVIALSCDPGSNILEGRSCCSCGSVAIVVFGVDCEHGVDADVVCCCRGGDSSRFVLAKLDGVECPSLYDGDGIDATCDAGSLMVLAYNCRA